MSELEDKGFLFHPHTSAGRIPTDRAYRVYVDEIMRLAPPTDEARETLRSELAGSRNALEEILRRAAQVLGVLTQELGVAVAPALDELVLERLELVPVSTERLLLVFNLRSGVVRTIFVEVPARVSPAVVQEVARILNERLAGLTLSRIRDIDRRAAPDAGRPAEEARAAQHLRRRTRGDLRPVGRHRRPSCSAARRCSPEQPEFASNARMRDLLRLTEGRDLLKQALAGRRRLGLSITIGGENPDTRLSEFTLVTSSYQAGELKGVIGVMGPTRMPYDKIIGLVEHTSRMVEGLLE